MECYGLKNTSLYKSLTAEADSEEDIETIIRFPKEVVAFIECQSVPFFQSDQMEKIENHSFFTEFIKCDVEKSPFNIQTYN